MSKRQHRQAQPAARAQTRPRRSVRLPPAPSAPRFGAALLTLLPVMAAAGYLLALQYDPTPGRAHEAVASVAQGALGPVRAAHAWLAAGILVLAAVHAMRALLHSEPAALRPRRWLTGVAALAVLTMAYFTGTTLPFDQQAWEAVQHLDQGANLAGLHVADENDPATAPLRALFLLHVFGVPVLLAAILAVHLHRGLPARAGARRLAALVRANRLGLAAGLGLVMVLAIMRPAEHGPAPVEGLAATRPDWPFLWLVPLQDALGSAGLWLLPAAIAALAAAPYALGRAASSRRRAAAALMVSAWLVLTFLGALI